MNPKIPKKALSFFDDLSQNNNREWFAEHKSEYKEIEEEVKSVFAQVYENLNAHDQVDKMKHYRIYRDIRFSKDKTPFKTHISVAYSRVKPALRGGYYVQIMPNNGSFLACGFWGPNPKDLLRIRKEFEFDDSEIRAVLNNKRFNQVWGNSFVGEEVKTAPKGFDKNHGAIDLIRKKQFILVKKLSDREVLSNDFVNIVDDYYKAVRPFFDYMSDVLTTNLNGESLI